MRAEASAVRPLARGALDRATTTLARAFASDPMFVWMFPDPERRGRALQIFIRVPLEYGLRYGYVTESQDAGAVSIWVPPGRTVSMFGMIRSGMLKVPFGVGIRPFNQFVGANAVMERIHKRHVREPHWYLLVVGVDPALQGRGLGSTLIRDGLFKADQAGCPCYLETSDSRNVAFYERHGFKVLAEALLGAGGPPAWGMRRDHAGAGAHGGYPAHSN
jgi:ribosomal protein S18 acetylase RimI-like enzyme